jgi:hypothetical protein
MRSLLVEAAQTATRVEPDLRRQYQRLKFRSATPVAKVAVARKLAMRLYWMLRSQTDTYSWFVSKVARSHPGGLTRADFLMERLASLLRGVRRGKPWSPRPDRWWNQRFHLY